MKSFLTVLMLSFCVFAVQSQSLEWAVNFETNNNEATAIVCDEVGNVYSAFNDITGNSAVSYRTGEVQLISQNPQGDINWEVQFAGSGRIFDMVVAQDKIYVLGLVKDSLQIATEWIYSFENQQYIAFILCINATGDIQWVTSTPWNENTMLVNIELDNETFYTVGLFNDVNSRLDSWDLDGNLIQSKLIEELRTLSDIEFDSMHNIYLSGTGDPNGVIDTVAYTNSTPPSSYLTFLIQLNTNWQAQWIRLEPFITFDFSPQIEIINDSIFLAYLHAISLNGGPMNVEIQAFNPTGESLLVYNSVESNGIFRFSTYFKYCIFAQPQFDEAGIYSKQTAVCTYH